MGYFIYSKKTSFDDKYTKLMKITNSNTIPRIGETIRVNMMADNGSLYGPHTSYRVVDVIYPVFPDAHTPIVCVKPIGAAEEVNFD